MFPHQPSSYWDALKFLWKTPLCGWVDFPATLAVWKRVRQLCWIQCRNWNILVGGLEHQFYFPRNIGNNHPNWLSYFSEGFKPPTETYGFWIIFLHMISWGVYRLAGASVEILDSVRALGGESVFKTWMSLLSISRKYCHHYHFYFSGIVFIFCKVTLRYDHAKYPNTHAYVMYAIYNIDTQYFSY